MRKICLLIVFFCAFAAWADDYVVLSPILYRRRFWQGRLLDFAGNLTGYRKWVLFKN